MTLTDYLGVPLFAGIHLVACANHKATRQEFLNCIKSLDNPGDFEILHNRHEIRYGSAKVIFRPCRDRFDTEMLAGYPFAHVKYTFNPPLVVSQFLRGLVRSTT